MSKLAVSLAIGAAFSSSFNTTMSAAPRKLGQIGDALAAVTRQNKKLEMFQEAERDLEVARGKLSAVQRELLQVKKAMQGATGEELKRLSGEAERLSSQAQKLSGSVERARAKVDAAGRAHREAADAATRQTGSLGRLGQSIEAMRAKQEKLTAAVSRYHNAQESMSNARASLFDAVAIGAGLKAAFTGAGQLQAKLADIAITADIPRERIAEIGKTLGDIARTTGQTREALAGGLQVLVASGLDADRATASLEAIGKTATASGAEVEDVSKTVFSLLDNLKVAPGEAIKAMDMLVAAGKAGRFELKDMAKYFPGMTADAAKLGLTGTQAVSALGASLQIALKGAADPAEAATNMKNYMAKLTAPDTVKNFKKMGVDIEAEFKGWAARGLNPIEESMKRIQKLTGGDGFKIGELFGDMQVKSFITPMLQQADEYRRIKAEVENSGGAVEADLARRKGEDPTQAWKRMGESLASLRDAAIVPLLAPLANLLDLTTAAIKPVTDWMQKNEGLVSVLGTTFGLLLGGKVAFAALSYGLSIVRVGVMALGVAMTANPIGLAIKGIALLATVIIANWGTIGPWFKSMWDKLAGYATAAWEGWKNLFWNWSPLGIVIKNWGAIVDYFKSLPATFMALGSDLISGLVSGIQNKFEALKSTVTGMGSSIAGWFKGVLGIRSPSRVFRGFGDMLGQGAALGILGSAPRVGKAVGTLAAATALAWNPAALATEAPVPPPWNPAALATEAPPPAAARGATGAAARQQITNHFQIVISQQPGENAEALAQRVAALIQAQQAQTRRAALGDWA